MSARMLLPGLVGAILLLGAGGVRLLPGDLSQPAAQVPAEVVEAHERFEAHERSDAAPAASPERQRTPPGAEAETTPSRSLDAPTSPPPEA